MFKRVANIQNTLQMFQTRYKYSKHVVVNVSTILYSQRVANYRKKIIRGKYQPPYRMSDVYISIPIHHV